MKRGYRRYRIPILNILVVLCISLVLAGCPSGSVEDKEEGDGGGKTASMILTADPASIPADGKSSATITAEIMDSATTPVASGTAVTFSTTMGVFQNGEATFVKKTEDDSGILSVSLRSGMLPGVAEVTAESNGVVQTVMVQFTGEGGAVTPASLSIATSKTSIKSDDSDAATVIATILDASNAVVEGATVVFSADGGSISDATIDTDAAGQAQVTFKSGTFDKSNRTATVTAEVGELSAFIPIRIVGSELALSTDISQLPDDGSGKALLTITASDAGGVKVYDTLISLTNAGTGSIQFEQFSADYPLDDTTVPTYTGRTDVEGRFKIYVKGTGAGSVTVLAEGLGDTKEIAYTVNPSSAVTFGISELQVDGVAADYEDPFPLYTDQELTVIVDAPDPGETEVTFATTLGEWDGTGKLFQTAAIVDGRAEARLTSTVGGVATVEVAYGNNTDTKDSLMVAVSPLTSEAAEITLQASAVVVAPSTGGSTNTVTLVATVKTDSGQVIRGVPVAFSIECTTGGGEHVSPVIVYTDSAGVAESTFTSGSLGTDTEGVTVVAEVIKSGTPIKDSIGIVIGGTAGSVGIGRGTEVELIAGCAAYRLCMAVLVADSNGNPVPGAEVSLSAWPVQYLTGGWYDVEPEPDKEKYVVYYSGAFDNEDENRNLKLDEDLNEDINKDGVLTPPNSAAGDLPATVTTNEFGWAAFDLDYLKAYAKWVKVRLSATTIVYGTETTSYTEFILPAEKNEAEAGLLPDSPWSAWTSKIDTGNTYIYTMPVFWGDYDVYSTNFGWFEYDPVTYIYERDYRYTFATPPAPGTVKEDIIISIVNTYMGVGITVPMRIVVP
ncbi:MAG: Ig-like domain-containing protein [Deltaproteobacteria bacterium]|nr:Ig-like domain-containing protein [Deltaproteobacteria bacterium]